MTPPDAQFESSPQLQGGSDAPLLIPSPKGLELSGTQPRVRLQRAPGIWGLEATPLQGDSLGLQRGVSPTAGQTEREPAAEAGKRRSPSDTYPPPHSQQPGPRGRGSQLRIWAAAPAPQPSRRCSSRPGGPRPPAAPHSPQLCPLPRPAPPGAYLPPELPRGSPGAGRGAARSLRVPRRAAGPRALWLRGARGRGLRAGGRRGSREAWRRRARRAGAAREGATGRGSSLSPPGGRALSPAIALAELRRARAGE